MSRLEEAKKFRTDVLEIICDLDISDEFKTFIVDSVTEQYFKGECPNEVIEEVAEIIAQMRKPKCTCGASTDPGSCGHSPNCPMKPIEG